MNSYERSRLIGNPYNAQTQKERSVQDFKSAFAERFYDSPDYEAVLIDGVVRDVLIVSTKSLNKKTLISKPDETFEYGNIIYAYKKYWLITDMDEKDTLYTKGIATLCNHTLRWQNFDGKIVEQQCVIERPYSNTTEQNQLISVSSKEYKIYVPDNPNTRKLYLDKRLILEITTDKTGNQLPLVYKITSFDGLAKGHEDAHLIILNVEQDVYNSSADRPDLMIADYTPIEVPPSNNTPSEYVVNILGDDNVFIGSDNLFLAETRLIDVAGDANYYWVVESGDTNISYELSGNKNQNLRIKVPARADLIGKSFALKCIDTVRDINSERNITIRGLV